MQANIAILESVTAGSRMRKARAGPGRRFAQGNSTQFAVATAELMEMHAQRQPPACPLTTGAVAMVVMVCFSEQTLTALYVL
jgi:hypothetical protein